MVVGTSTTGCCGCRWWGNQTDLVVAPDEAKRASADALKGGGAWTRSGSVDGVVVPEEGSGSLVRLGPLLLSLHIADWGRPVGSSTMASESNSEGVRTTDTGEE